MIPYLVIGLRLLVPFSILRWPFWGMLASFLADATDVILLDFFGHGIFALYGQQIDKVADIYYLSFAFFVSFRWQDRLIRRTLIFLFLWRLVGVIIFEITRIRQILFFAPNIFENFYLLIAASQKFFPKFYLDSTQKVVTFLLIAAIPKLAQEFIMHFIQFQTWAFVKENIFRWR